MPRSPEPARRALIEAAEELFAERGVDAVPAGDIAREAGQRNNSAVQYHFGDKQGLVQAVLDKHQDRIDVSRNELLDHLEARGDASLRDVVDVLVQPLASLLEKNEGRRFLQIQAQILATRDVSEAWARRRGSRRMIRWISDLGGDLAGSQGAHARALMITLLFHGLADFARRRPRATTPERRGFSEALAEALVAILRAKTADR